MRSSITVAGEVRTETPANVSVLDSRQLAATPGVSLDDRLRMTPGFSLFRRSSSVAANPTTQGVSLRGLGSTGASRTLVLWDGAPVNDPFGGWVYWTRLAPEAIDRVEVSRGASISLFGDRAMGGTVALFSRPADRARANGYWESGGRGTHMAGAGFSRPFGRAALSANGRAFTTDGYYIVEESRRGRADAPAYSRFAAADARLDVFTGGSRWFLRGDMLAEERGNGTALQRNSTSLGMAAAHYARAGPASDVSVLGYHTRGEFRASFSAIAADRAAERLTSLQSVPSDSWGGAGLYRRKGARWNAVFGADGQRAEGYSVETLFPLGLRKGGGTLTQSGLFSQWDARAGAARFFVGARQQFAGGGNRFFSPNAGMTVGRGAVRGRVSAYRAFRAPTLNEMYREFRAGNVVTLANDRLRPETLAGAEAGLEWRGERARLGFTFFRNSLDGVITNVTLSAAPDLTVRQRRNAARALTRGFEAEGGARLFGLDWQASYLYADSRFAGGARIPQVPRHQGSAETRFERGGTLLSVGARAYAAQFEDDRNLDLLPGFAVMQIVAAQRLAGGLSAQAAVENALDRTFLVGYGPTPNVGAPRLWRAGLRYAWR